MNSCWDFFDKFYILTTNKSKRIPKIIDNLKSVGIRKFKICKCKSSSKNINNCKDNPNLSLLNILKHNLTDKTSINIAHNHFKLIEKAYSKKLKNVIILEDDAEFIQPFNYIKLYDIIDFLKHNKWDIFYFGHVPYPIPVNIIINQTIVRPISTYTTHCYAISRQGMKKILYLKTFYKNMHIDKWFSTQPLIKYAAYLSLNYQNINPGLYDKAFELMNIKYHPSFKNVNIIFEHLSIYTPYIIFIFIIYILRNPFYSIIQYF